jgi:hypothetical protein
MEATMSVTDKYPELLKYLDPSTEYVNSSQEITLNGERLLVITQVGELDGGQVSFRRTEDGWEVSDSDTIVDVMQPTSFRNVMAASRAAVMVCGASSAQDHAKVANLIVDQVDDFSSRNGPDGGNLACVWAVRHLVFMALNRWITRTDGTAVFDPELQRCFGHTSQFEDVPAGGLIISPTMTNASGTRNIGHVGLLGPQTTRVDDRLVYSNSSGMKVWKQNFTVGSWIARYRTRKGLKVRTYPLPLSQSATS